MAKYIGKVTLDPGSVSNCSLQFSSDEDTGIYSNGTNLVNISAGGTNTVQVSNTGITVTGLVTATNVTITSLNSTGIIHTNGSGSLSTSLIVDADISGSASIANSKLAGNPSTTNTASTIVLRNASGNSSHGALTSNSIIVSGITYPTPGTLTDASYAVTSASNVLSFTTITPYLRIFGSRGYNNTTGYSFANSSSANTFTQCSLNGNIADTVSGMTQTATGLTVLTAGTYVVLGQISCRTSNWAQRIKVTMAVNSTTSSFADVLGDVGGLGLSTFYMSATTVNVLSCAINDTLSIYMSSDSASTNATILSWNIVAFRI